MQPCEIFPGELLVARPLTQNLHQRLQTPIVVILQEALEIVLEKKVNNLVVRAVVDVKLVNLRRDHEKQDVVKSFSPKLVDPSWFEV